METGYWAPPKEDHEDGGPCEDHPRLIDAIHELVMDSIAHVVADSAPVPAVGSATSTFGRRLAAAANQRTAPRRAAMLHPPNPSSDETTTLLLTTNDRDPNDELSMKEHEQPHEQPANSNPPPAPRPPPQCSVQPRSTSTSRDQPKIHWRPSDELEDARTLPGARGPIRPSLCAAVAPQIPVRPISATVTCRVGPQATETQYQRRVRLARVQEHRQQGAVVRRELAPRVPQLTKAAMWATLVQAELMGSGLFDAMIRIRVARRVAHRILPTFRLRCRRKEIEEKSAEIAEKQQPPGPDAYSNDAVMSMLPFRVLKAIVARAKPRRYCPREPIMYQNVADAGGTCFIESGNVDVLIRRNRQSAVVATLGPGSIIGSMAMITGGTRTATVRAATEVIAWECNRATLIALQEDSESELAGAVRAAMAEVMRLHESNLQKMWLEKFTTEDFMAFGAFEDVNDGAIRSVRSLMTVRVAQPGEKIITKGSRPASAFLLLRGSVRILWPKSQDHPLNCFGESADFTDAVAKCVDVPVAVGRDSALNELRNACPRPQSPGANRGFGPSHSRAVQAVPAPARAAVPHRHAALHKAPPPATMAPSSVSSPPASAAIVPCLSDFESEGAVMSASRRQNSAQSLPAHRSCTVSASALLGLQLVLLNEISPVDIVVATNSDILILDRDFSVELALTEASAVSHLQANCNRLAAPWLQPMLRKNALRAAVAQLPPDLSTLFRKLESKPDACLTSARPIILECGQTLAWRREDQESQDVVFILEGAVSAPGCTPGCMWPPLFEAYYGCEETAAIVTRRLCAWQWPRSELVMMIDTFEEESVKVLELHLAEQFMCRFKIAPHMAPVSEKYDQRLFKNATGASTVSRVENSAGQHVNDVTKSPRAGLSPSPRSPARGQTPPLMGKSKARSQDKPPESAAVSSSNQGTSALPPEDDHSVESFLQQVTDDYDKMVRDLNRVGPIHWKQHSTTPATTTPALTMTKNNNTHSSVRFQSDFTSRPAAPTTAAPAFRPQTSSGSSRVKATPPKATGVSAPRDTTPSSISEVARSHSPPKELSEARQLSTGTETATAKPQHLPGTKHPEMNQINVTTSRPSADINDNSEENRGPSEDCPVVPLAPLQHLSPESLSVVRSDRPQSRSQPECHPLSPALQRQRTTSPSPGRPLEVTRRRTSSLSLASAATLSTASMPNRTGTPRSSPSHDQTPKRQQNQPSGYGQTPPRTEAGRVSVSTPQSRTTPQTPRTERRSSGLTASTPTRSPCPTTAQLNLQGLRGPRVGARRVSLSETGPPGTAALTRSCSPGQTPSSRLVVDMNDPPGYAAPLKKTRRSSLSRSGPDRSRDTTDQKKCNNGSVRPQSPRTATRRKSLDQLLTQHSGGPPSTPPPHGHGLHQGLQRHAQPPVARSLKDLSVNGQSKTSSRAATTPSPHWPRYPATPSPRRPKCVTPSAPLTPRTPQARPRPRPDCGPPAMLAAVPEDYPASPLLTDQY